ncbi:hypothetical protein D9M71_372680 [compost metagenome]
MIQLRGAAQRVAVAVAHAVAFIDEVQVRIEMHDMDRPAPFEGLDHRSVDRVVTAQHHRHGACCENLAHGRFDVGVAGFHVGVNDIGIADIDHAQLVIGQVGGVIFKVVGTGMAEREQRRGLADTAWSEACPRSPLGPHVVGRAKDRHVGINGSPVGANGRLGEGAMAHEGQVQTAGFITVLCHVRVSPRYCSGQETGRLLDHRCSHYGGRPVRAKCASADAYIAGAAVSVRMSVARRTPLLRPGCISKCQALRLKHAHG